MRKALCMAVLLLAASSSANAAAIHSDPAADDNARIYLFFVETASPVSLVLDDAAPISEPAQSVVFTRLEPGAHNWSVSLPDGSRAAADFTLSAEGMIESKARRWWRLAGGVRNGQITLLQLSAAQCKKAADEGPD
jgi:hypothetical protein